MFLSQKDDVIFECGATANCGGAADGWTDPQSEPFQIMDPLFGSEKEREEEL